MKESPRTILEPTESLPTAQEENEAYRVTLEILSMARKRARDIPFFLFSVNPLSNREESLCKEARMTCIPGVWDHLERQKAHGVTVGVVNDGHWNKAGNRYVGEYLVHYLRHNPVAQEVLTRPKLTVSPLGNPGRMFYGLF